MRKFFWIIGGLVALIAGFFIWVNIAYPNYSYRYRLTIALDIDGQVHTGSSVIEIEWAGGPPFADVGPYFPRVRGEAVLVELGERGVVIAGLNSGMPEVGATSAIFLAAQAFGNRSTLQELPAVPKLKGRRDLAPNNMPRLIWFPRRDDPATGRRFTVEDIPNLFGPAARLATAYVEITRDPIVIDMDKKLSWYKTWADSYRTQGVGGQRHIQLSDGTDISPYMFVGGAS